MKRNATVSAIVLAGVAVVVALVLGMTRSGQPDPGTPVGAGTGVGAGQDGAATAGRLVRADSHRLSTAGDGKVTLVEFLDFECESCRAAFPLVEQLRKDYAGKVTFVIRYFPIDSHANAVNAALAVEAAAAQGKLEPMYARMYETQSEWGEQQESKAGLFRSYAMLLGLDMTAYDAAIKDPATLARVNKDREDGRALGVQGTPTFFLNGKKLEPTSAEDFRAQIDAALK